MNAQMFDWAFLITKDTGMGIVCLDRFSSRHENTTFSVFPSTQDVFFPSVLYFNLDYRPVHRLWIWIAIQTQPRKINFENQVCHGKINMLISERDQILFHQGLLLSLHPAVLLVTRRKITLDTQNPPPVIHLTYWRVWTKTQYLVIFKIIAKLLCCYEIIYLYKWNQWNG